MRASVFVLLGAIVACADPTAVADESIADESIDDAPVILRFTLARVNDQPLPTDPPTGAGQWDYDGSIVKLTAARLALRADGTYMLTWVHRSTLNGASSISEMLCTGTYVSIGQTLIRFDGAAGTVGQITRDGLTWSWGGDYALGFESQPLD